MHNFKIPQYQVTYCYNLILNTINNFCTRSYKKMPFEVYMREGLVQESTSCLPTFRNKGKHKQNVQKLILVHRKFKGKTVTFHFISRVYRRKGTYEDRTNSNLTEPCDAAAVYIGPFFFPVYLTILCSRRNLKSKSD